MIQCLKHKAKERPEKRRGNKVNELRPPHLEQPGQRNTMPSNELSWLCFKCHACLPFLIHLSRFVACVCFLKIYFLIIYILVNCRVYGV